MAEGTYVGSVVTGLGRYDLFIDRIDEPPTVTGPHPETKRKAEHE